MSHSLERRIHSIASQQFTAKPVRLVEDAITGRQVLVTAGRSQRHQESEDRGARLATAREDCYFCKLETTSTAFWIDRALAVHLATEERSLECARLALEAASSGGMEQHYDLVKRIAPENRLPGDWLARTFPNLTPALGSTGLCLVTSLAPEYHYEDFPDLPRDAVEAFLRSWSFIEREMKDTYTIVPLINGGRHRLSGQSVACPHVQTYLPKDEPALYREIARRRELLFGGACQVCAVLEEAAGQGLLVAETADFRLLAHPAPERSWGLLLAPRAHVDGFETLDLSALAGLLQRAVGGLRAALGGEPGWNLSVRCGPSVGHLHMEIIPKTTNTPAGFEAATGVWAVDADPLDVASALRGESR